MNDKKKITEAQKKAVKKYKEGKYKQLKVEIKVDEYNLIDEFSKEKGISKARLIVESIKYCIDHNINLNG